MSNEQTWSYDRVRSERDDGGGGGADGRLELEA